MIFGLAELLELVRSPCERCGGAVKIITCFEEPAVTAKILEHLERQGSPELKLPPARAPP